MTTIHLIDTHCHLTNQRFAVDRETVIAGLREAGVWQVICIGTGVSDARAVRDLCERHPGLVAGAAGLDPFSCHEAGMGFASELEALETLLRSGTWCGLGEIGLEYHHAVAPHDVQRVHFDAQLDLARRLDLPVIIHVRDAHADAVTVLGNHPGVRGVIHSFSGGIAEAEGYLELGLHLSLNGMLGYKGNQALRDAATSIPNDRLLVETDAPYLPPMPYRGRRCDPAMVSHTADLLAELRGERPEDIRAWTTRNACALFRLPLPPEWVTLPGAD